jgi:hypothetical protein
VTLTHLDILLDQVEAAGKRARACAKNAVGDRDADYWPSDLIGETDALNAAIEELRRELKKIIEQVPSDHASPVS